MDMGGATGFIILYLAIWRWEVHPPVSNGSKQGHFLISECGQYPFL